MRALWSAVALAIACTVGGSAAAQPSGPAPTQALAPPVTVAPFTVIGQRPVDPNRPRLELYEQRDLGGGGVILVAPTPNLVSRGFADRARSAHAVGPWELCAGPDFGSPCQVVEGEVAFLGGVGLSERISSARPVPRR